VTLSEAARLWLAPAPAYSVVQPRVDTLALRAEAWQASLQKLGILLPAFVVHDLGLLLAVPREQLSIAPARALPAALPAAAAPDFRDEYRSLCLDFAECQACREAKALRPSDDMVVALLARLLGRVAQKSLPFSDDPERHALQTLAQLAEARLYLLTLADSLDTSTLTLISMLGDKVPQGALNVVDLLAAFASPQTRAIVQFSLQILPSVLEAKHKPAVSDYAAFGYAGLSRRGSIDSLVLTEFFWDDPEFERRLLEREVLYYAREQGQEETRRVHHLLIDASASMRGQRTTFARGMALATAKKLLLTGDDVTLRFFDSRLYEAHSCHGGQLPVAQLLSFRGERGRNPARVFEQLAVQLELLARRDARQQVVQFFTHAALYIPRPLVERLTQLASLLGVFMLPSQGKLELDYLDLLDQHWVVDAAALSGGQQQSQQAARILRDVKATPGKHTEPHY
jgi:hypothetical protein